MKQLMTELSIAYGHSRVSYDTVRCWKNKFESGVESIKKAPKSGRPTFASRKEIVSKITEIVEGDAKFTVRATKSRHITSNDVPHFVESFESPKDFC